MSISVDPDWWKKIFDEVYLITDARSVCDDDLTRQEVDLILEMIPIRRDHRILDLCGGHGRHSLELCSRGFINCTLLDYSGYLIAHARSNAERKHYRLDLIQGDARDTGLPAESYDHVLILGNSLGYIAEAEADKEILLEAKRVLRKNGWILVDVTDGSTVKESLTPTAWHEIDEDKVVCRQRELIKNRVNARELVLSKKEGKIRDSTYSIRIYRPGELAEIMEKTGFQRVGVQSDFRAHKTKGDYGFMNRRMLAVGRKS
jgi:D-alanine-D-alanine ligase